MNNPILYPYYENQYWWKFANVLSWLNEHSILLEDDFIEVENDFEGFSEWFFSLVFDQYKELYEEIEGVPYLKQPVLDIFNLLQKRYVEHYVFKTRGENAEEAEKEAHLWVKKLLNTIEYTYKKYSKVIDLYNDNYNALMKQLESTSESGTRFNDTPQQKEVSLSFEDNEYTTNLTKMKSVSKSDSDTPVNKIEEIIRNYRNILLIWLDEFDGLFVKEGNV